jgi:glyoxylase-like metal-dependent hydrolase (beta-lactamase superfamily II)
MKYQIEIYRNGVTQAPGPEMFYLRDWDKQYTLCTYVFVLRSKQHTMLVDTGCGNIDGINRMLAEEFGGKISFDLPEEETISAIVEKANINPEKVDHVFISHLHHDHASNVAMFPNARVVVSRRGIFEYLNKRRPYFYNDLLYPPGPVQHIVGLSSDQLVYVGEEAEVLPGIRCFWVGGHTPGCMAVQVDTARGRVVFTSDVAFFEENVTSGHPIGMFYNLWECHEAYKKIRAAADHIITSHDPGVLERFPGGKI